MRNENFPNAGIMTKPHRVAPAIPLVEAADDADTAGIRCPQRKTNAINAIHLQRLCAKHAIGCRMIAFTQQDKLFGLQLGPEGIGINQFGFGA